MVVYTLPVFSWMQRRRFEWNVLYDIQNLKNVKKLNISDKQVNRNKDLNMKNSELLLNELSKTTEGQLVVNGSEGYWAKIRC